jgi:hypothetical protein
VKKKLLLSNGCKGMYVGRKYFLLRTGEWKRWDDGR